MFMEIQFFDNSEPVKGYDLAVEQAGYEKCKPAHFYGPAIRQHWLIHYVKRGKGIFRYQDKTMEITAGEIFLIYPHEVNFYQADSVSPWEYYWLGFSGSCTERLLQAAGFSREARSVTYRLSTSFSLDETIKELTKKKIMSGSDKIFEIAKLYEIFTWLLKNRESQGLTGSIADGRNSLLKAAEEHMKRSYMMDIKISDVARHIGVDRTQLYRYFKDGYDMSPKQYLINIRMKQARKLVESTRLPIKQIAYSVGYQDQYLFSKMYKSTYGASPKNHRNIIQS
jgi:AraC-like DNA-binding protein